MTRQGDDPSGSEGGKLAILGGGVGAITAAFALSEPGWERRWDSITVYQQGWRLGGKGASGRGPAGRIEEHGLHVWLGFYENAFRLMRECYDELARPADHPLASIDAAFLAASRVGTMDFHDQDWQVWLANFAENDLKPGVEHESDCEFTMLELVRHSLDLARTTAQSLRAPSKATAPFDLRTTEQASAVEQAPYRLFPAHAEGPRFELPGLVEKVETVGRDLVDLAFVAIVAALELVESLEDALSAVTPAVSRPLFALLDQALVPLRQWVEDVADDDDERRRGWYVVEIALAHVRGIFAHGLLLDERGLDAVDDWEYVDWLLEHGCAWDAAQSTFIRTLIYDLPFSYERGEYDRPRAEAGTAIRNAARFFFRYKGSLMWKMGAGMGDTVFAPYYEVLKRRGVRFEFFSQVRDLRLSADGTTVEGITIRQQATLREEHRAAGYQPLITVEGVESWPAMPLVDQLEQNISPDDVEWWFTDYEGVGDYELELGTDFDQVLFGISLGAIPNVASELVRRHDRWRDMVDHIGTCQTQAFQVWLRGTSGDLGWPFGWSTVGGFVEPFDTWADMSHLIRRESFHDGSVGSIGYFCNVFPDTPNRADRERNSYLADARDEVKQNAIEFLRTRSWRYWPNAASNFPADFDWTQLVDPGRPMEVSEPAKSERFDSQYWRVNVDPSERYVQALPGTSKYRIMPGDTAISNLVACGDWTYTRLNSGCVESATISGLLAANALTGSPTLEQISGFFGI